MSFTNSFFARKLTISDDSKFFGSGIWQPQRQPHSSNVNHWLLSTHPYNSHFSRKVCHNILKKISYFACVYEVHPLNCFSCTKVSHHHFSDLLFGYATVNFGSSLGEQPHSPNGYHFILSALSTYIFGAQVCHSTLK